MHDLDPAQPRPAHRPFVPRLVVGDGEPGPAPACRPVAQQVELQDPTVREVADSLADLFLGAKPGEPRKGDVPPAPMASPGGVRGGIASNPRPTRFLGQSGAKPGQW